MYGGEVHVFDRTINLAKVPLPDAAAVKAAVSRTGGGLGSHAVVDGFGSFASNGFLTCV